MDLEPYGEEPEGPSALEYVGALQAAVDVDAPFPDVVVSSPWSVTDAGTFRNALSTSAWANNYGQTLQVLIDGTRAGVDMTLQAASELKSSASKGRDEAVRAIVDWARAARPRVIKTDLFRGAVEDAILSTARRGEAPILLKLLPLAGRVHVSVASIEAGIAEATSDAVRAYLRSALITARSFHEL